MPGHHNFNIPCYFQVFQGRGNPVMCVNGKTLKSVTFILCHCGSFRFFMWFCVCVCVPICLCKIISDHHPCKSQQRSNGGGKAKALSQLLWHLSRLLSSVPMKSDTVAMQVKRSEEVKRRVAHWPHQITSSLSHHVLTTQHIASIMNLQMYKHATSHDSSSDRFMHY